MSQIERHVSVACPFLEAETRLHRFFQNTGNRNGDTSKLKLIFEVPMPGVEGGLLIGRSVIATMQTLPKSATSVRYRIQWAPEHPGPFPLFAGELTAAAEDATDRFALRLAGTYQPPLGAAGAVFDELAGNRIAQRTASRLLAQIRDFIERDAHAAGPPAHAHSHLIVGTVPSAHEERHS